MKSSLLLLITIDVIDGRVLGIDNSFYLTLILILILPIGKNEVGNDSGKYQHSSNDTTHNYAPFAAGSTLPLRFTAGLFFATFLTPVLFCRTTSNLLAHEMHQLSTVLYINLFSF